MDFCKTGQCLQKVILSLVQTICFLSLLEVVLISGHYIHLSWVERLCLFPWGGFSVRWGRNHNKPTHQHSTGSLACDTNWKVRLQIAILQPFDPEAVGNSSQNASPPLLCCSAFHVQACWTLKNCMCTSNVLLRDGISSTPFFQRLTINPKLVGIHQEMHFSRETRSAPSVVAKERTQN